jgi:glycosyltransferase involved in cell wall biosynthesis
VRKIRVVFVVNGFAVGGGEKKLLELVEKIQKTHAHAFRVTVCSVGQGGPLEPEFRKTGVRTVVFHKRGKYDVSLIWKVARLLREEKADLVQTTLFYADVIGSLAAKLAGVRRVVSWEAITQPYGWKHMTAYRLAAKGFGCSVAVSKAIQNKVVVERHVPRHKTRTIHYGIDLNRFRPKRNVKVREELGLRSGDTALGTVARFTEQKGHTVLLDAAPVVLKAFPRAHFIFAGDGPLRETLQAQSERLGLMGRVHFLGFRSDVPEMLNAFDVFVLPSLYEGLPNAVLEAMACGLPVVATRVDGTPEAVVHGESGLLVDPADPRRLADALVRVLSNARLRNRLGRAARKRVETRFGLDAQITEFLELYRSDFGTRRF